MEPGLQLEKQNSKRQTAEMLRGVYPERTAEILLPQGGIRMTSEGLSMTPSRLCHSEPAVFWRAKNLGS
jgi:hypothetical protein